MNAYLELKRKHQDEVNAFPMSFAFTNKQFEEGMRKLGLEPTDLDKIYRLPGTGGFYRKTDAPTLHEMLERHEAEMQAAVDADKTGDGFIYQMFAYELANHEFVITWDIEPTLYALGLTVEEVNADPRLKHGLNKAKKAQYEQG